MPSFDRVILPIGIGSAPQIVEVHGMIGLVVVNLHRSVATQGLVDAW